MSAIFTEITYQDWVANPRQDKLILNIISRYKGSADFVRALQASQYFRGENPEVAKKTVLKATATEIKDTTTGKVRKRWQNTDVVGNRVGSSFFRRFVVQENQHLLANGVTVDSKEKLGPCFDKTLEAIGEYALQHGVCWGFWNADHLEAIPAAKDWYTGAVALLDEATSAPMVLVQFWQIASDKPLHVRVFEPDGLTEYVADDKDSLSVAIEKRAYVRSVMRDALGEMVTGESNYSKLPVVPLYANAEHMSELSPSIKAKIDAYDNITSDLCDNLDRANDVYWVLNNFGGSENDIATMIEQINRIKAVVNRSDGMGGGSTAEPRTIEVPYEARRTALELLRKALHEDFMALDMEALTGGSLTNVAIKAATANLEMKCDRYEWQVLQFVQQVLALVGVHTEEIRFTRQSIANDAETIDAIYKMRGDIDRRTALELNPYIIPEQVDGILAALALEEVSGMTSAEELQKQIDAETDEQEEQEEPEEADA